MRGVVLEISASLLAERSRLGLDVRDEMWEGELHMPPQPTGEHQLLGSELLQILGPIAKGLGLRAVYETATTRSDQSYRVPDLLVVDPSLLGDRGIEAAPAFAVEIRSPNDETDTKRPFYAAFGVPELLVIDRDTKAVELFVLRDGELLAATADDDGWVRSSVLGLGFRTAGHQVEVDVDGVSSFIP